MADFLPLKELHNQARPGRRNDKTYGKKKAQNAAARALHFDLFGGGGDENVVAQKIVTTNDERNVAIDMAKLTVMDRNRDITAQTLSPIDPDTRTRQETSIAGLDHPPRRDLQPSNRSPNYQSASEHDLQEIKLSTTKSDSVNHTEQKELYTGSQFPTNIRSKLLKKTSTLQTESKQQIQAHDRALDSRITPTAKLGRQTRRQAITAALDLQARVKVKVSELAPAAIITESQAEQVSQTTRYPGPPRRQRKLVSRRKMVELTPEKLEKLKPLLKLADDPLIKDFEELGRSMDKKYTCTKIGEGAYSDVYTFEPRNPEEAETHRREGGAVIKVIPFQADTVDPASDLTDLNGIFHEVRVLKALSPHQGFAHCRGVKIVHGEYPDVLKNAFTDFKKINPAEIAINRLHRGKYLYAILEMGHVGTAVGLLSSYSAFQAYDLFWYTALTLAGAEAGMQFEHRDLHNSNVCYKASKPDGRIDADPEWLASMDERPRIIFGRSSIEVNIIDFTMARMRLNDGTVVFDPMTYFEEDHVDDEAPEIDQLQQRTYALVRDNAIAAEEAAAARDGAGYKPPKDKYERYNPASNVLWLVYFGTLLLQRKVKVLPGSNEVATALQEEMWKGLKKLVKELKGGKVEGGANGVVGLGMERSWLSADAVDSFFPEDE